MTNSKTNPLANPARTTRVKDAITAIDLQYRRIRWATGVSEATARCIASLAFGEVR